MSKPFWRGFVLGAVLFAAVIGSVWAWVEGRSVAVPPLSPVVKRVLVPTRTVERLPGDDSAVEWLHGRTVTSEVDPESLRVLALQLCPPVGESPPGESREPDGPAPTSIVPPPQRPPVQPLTGYVDFDATKHVGLDPDNPDRIVAGWTGTASCMVGETRLFSSPFDQEMSESLSELAPKDYYPAKLPRLIETAIGLTTDPAIRARLSVYRQDHRWGWWVAADYVPDPASYVYSVPVVSDYYDQQNNAAAIQSSSEPSWRFAVGVSRRWGRP